MKYRSTALNKRMVIEKVGMLYKMLLSVSYEAYRRMNHFLVVHYLYLELGNSAFILTALKNQHNSYTLTTS
ncbi:MAG: hypothetical protein EOP45_08960 [Sphingobacteriaceae bacterium]|nr:MAG: hypothetical protein EOP45_08960 [Sphingobacteriaceae bacterium]